MTAAAPAFIPAPAPPTRPASPALARHAVTAIIAICWLLSAVSFQGGGGIPGGEYGPYAIVKALTRVAAILVLGLMLMTSRRWAATTDAIWRLIPMGVFAAWTIASTMWSPLVTITLSHSVETLMLTMLAMTAGIACQTDADVSRLLKHMVLIVCLICIVLGWVNYPVVLMGFRPNQLMQPNNIGAVAAIGLILVTGARAIWNWRWSRRLFFPVIFVCGSAILIARSRSCLLTTIVILTPLLVRIYRVWLAAALLLMVGLASAASPFSETISHFPDTAAEYMMRGQTAEDAYTVSGRTELWLIGLDAFRESPIIGHGYYVMTGTGSMRVWGAERWQTAHNTYLHVITGTGLAGIGLLIWALLYALGPTMMTLFNPGRRPRVLVLAAYIVAWCLILGCFELSFAGPVDPMVLTFFIMVGLAAGYFRRKSQLPVMQKGFLHAHPGSS